MPGLPNDHYHAFADPMVFVLLGLGVAAVVRTIPRPGGALLGAAVLTAVLGWNVANLPPPVHPDGGFPAAAQAAERIDAALTRRRHRADRCRPTPVAARLQVDRGRGLPAGPTRSPLRRRGARGGGAGWRGARQRRCGRRRGGGRHRGPGPPVRRPVQRGHRGAVRRSGRGERDRPTPGARHGDRCSNGSRSLQGGSCRCTGALVDRIANAGAPDAGVRCPRDPDGGGRSGPCLICVSSGPAPGRSHARPFERC